MKAQSIRGKRTRAKILAAARQLFRSNGVNATSVDDILKASATGKSQFYHYFGSKDKLVQEIIQTTTDELPADYIATLADVSSSIDLCNWLQTIVTQQEKGSFRNGCPLGTLISEVGTSHPEHFTKIISEWQAALEQALSRCGLSSQDKAKAMAGNLMAAIQGALLLGQLGQGSVYIKGIMDWVRSTLAQSNKRQGATTLQTSPNRPMAKKPKSYVGFCP